MNIPFAKSKGPQLTHGVQLALAVSLSYLISVACGLPESFWAVMSALIVTRPNTGATLGAGWDRVRGTVFGTLFGLAGVWVRHHGLGTPLSTLGIIAVLAFASALLPALRAAPIAALIVLTSSGIGGHSAMQVAGLRVAEIAIGVVTGLAVAMLAPGSRASLRFDRDCAALLRRAAHTLVLPVAVMSIEDREAAAAARRAAVRELVVLGMAADRERHLPFGRVARAREAGVHQRIAFLASRTVQDADLFLRLFEAMPKRRADAAWKRHVDTAATALAESADAIERPGEHHPMPAVDALRELARPSRAIPGDEASAASIATLLGGPATLLARDLVGLIRLSAAASPDSGI